MKRLFPLSVLLALLSLIAGYLFSQMSFFGRLGVSLFYKEYTFLKTWWKGALVMFVVLFVLMILQNIVQQKLDRKKAVLIHLTLLIIALIGMYFTYNDFQSYYKHRWLKEKFHLGGYLFWIGWICISLFYIFERKKEKVLVNE